MKALSVKQPWAGNIAMGIKLAEIRPRKIRPQGDIVICASINKFKGIGNFHPDTYSLWLYPNDICDYYGYAIAVVNWYNTVIFTKDLSGKAKFDSNNWPFGFNAIAGMSDQFAWMFQNPRLIEPFQVKGQQGLFKVDDNLIKYK